MRDDQYYKLPDSDLRLVPFGPTADQSAVAEALLSALPAWDQTSEAHKARTPERFAKMLHDMTTREEFEFTTFPNGDLHSKRSKLDQMIVLAPIPFYTFCAHHIVPFYGNVYIGYIPDQKMAGLSKFPRAVRYVAKGFWVQEELTEAIADFLTEKLQPLGLAVVVKAEHMCMSMRGVQQPGVVTTTSSMRGVYLDTTKGARAEFLQLIGGQK